MVGLGVLLSLGVGPGASSYCYKIPQGDTVTLDNPFRCVHSFGHVRLLEICIFRQTCILWHPGGNLWRSSTQLLLNTLLNLSLRPPGWFIYPESVTVHGMLLDPGTGRWGRRIVRTVREQL